MKINEIIQNDDKINILKIKSVLVPQNTKHIQYLKFSPTPFYGTFDQIDKQFWTEYKKYNLVHYFKLYPHTWSHSRRGINIQYIKLTNKINEKVLLEDIQEFKNFHLKKKAQQAKFKNVRIEDVRAQYGETNLQFYLNL